MRQFPVICCILAVIALLGLWVAGCNDNGGGPTGSVSENPALLSVTPEESATGVGLNDSICMAFNMPMDTASVRSAFHLAGGPHMQQWMDSLGRMGGMGGMMNMNAMMRWMDTIEYDGHFEWNRQRDSACFIPDSMYANSPQLMFLFGNVRATNGRLMVMDTFNYGGYMRRFTTGQ